MALELIWRTARVAGIARRFRPHVMVAKTGVAIGAAGRLLRIPTIVFDDTEFAWLQVSLSSPLATVICTGAGYERSFGARHLRYGAVPHLIYTHPARFQPDPDLLRRYGVDPDQPFTAVRVKQWNAAHDVGVRGPTDAELRELILALQAFGRVVLSTERPLPRDLAELVSPLPAGSSLHLLAYAQLYVGEGSSMAAEAACLGTPAVYVSPKSRRGYLDAMERQYGHVRTVPNVSEAIRVSRAWLATPEAKLRAIAAREHMVHEQPDPLGFMLDVIRRYAPRSGASSVTTNGARTNG